MDHPPRPPPGFTVPENMPQRLLMALCGVIAFMLLPVPTLALTMMALARFGIGVPPPEGGVTVVLRLLVMAALGGAALWQGLRIRQQLKVDQRRSERDAVLRTERMRRQGTLANHADAVLRARARTASPPNSGRVLPEQPPTSSRPAAPERRDTPVALPAVADPVGQLVPGNRFARRAVDTKIRCTWCATPVSPSEGDANTGEATCPSCSTRFSMRDEMHKEMGNRPKPFGLDVQTIQSTLFITHQTSSGGTGCGVLILGTFLLLATLPDGLNSGRWIGTVVVGAVCIAILAVNRLVAARKTAYTISEDSVAVEIYGPLGRSLGTWMKSEIDQVFVRRRERTHRVRERDRFGTERRRKRVTTTYDVYLRDVKGSETRLAKDLEHLDWALYIEQEIENRLGVEDRAMGKGPSR